MVLDLVLLNQVLRPFLPLVYEDTGPNIAKKVHFLVSVFQEELLYLLDKEANCPLLLSMADVCKHTKHFLFTKFKCISYLISTAI